MKKQLKKLGEWLRDDVVYDDKRVQRANILKYLNILRATDDYLENPDFIAIWKDIFGDSTDDILFDLD
jgi:hypothetical protein